MGPGYMPKGGARVAAERNAAWRSEVAPVAASVSTAARDSETLDSDLTGVQVRVSAPVPPHRTNSRHPLLPAVERYCYLGAGVAGGILFHAAVFAWR